MKRSSTILEFYHKFVTSKLVEVGELGFYGTYACSLGLWINMINLQLGHPLLLVRSAVSNGQVVCICQIRPQLCCYDVSWLDITLSEQTRICLNPRNCLTIPQVSLVSKLVHKHCEDFQTSRVRITSWGFLAIPSRNRGNFTCNVSVISKL